MGKSSLAKVRTAAGLSPCQQWPALAHGAFQCDGVGRIHSCGGSWPSGEKQAARESILLEHWALTLSCPLPLQQIKEYLETGTIAGLEGGAQAGDAVAPKDATALKFL